MESAATDGTPHSLACRPGSWRAPRAFPRFPLLKGNPNAFDTADNGLLSRALHLLSGFSALQGGAVDVHCSMLVGHSVAMSRLRCL